MNTPKITSLQGIMLLTAIRSERRKRDIENMRYELKNKGRTGSLEERLPISKRTTYYYQ